MAGHTVGQVSILPALRSSPTFLAEVGVDASYQDLHINNKFLQVQVLALPVNVWPWVHYCTTPGLGFLICKMGGMTALSA